MSERVMSVSSLVAGGLLYLQVTGASRRPYRFVEVLKKRDGAGHEGAARSLASRCLANA
jgi:hypothetical protein